MPRFVAVASSVGIWVGLAIGSGCQGPDEFFRFNDASQTGTAGASPAGVAGTTGVGGNASGAAGTGGGPTGNAGATGSPGSGGSQGGGGGAVTGAGGSGTGTGGAGTLPPPGRGGSSAGSGGSAGGSGGATGTAGSAGARGGTTGTAGGPGGRGGTTATAGTGGSGSGAAGSSAGSGGAAGGASGGAGGGAGPRIQVVAQCQGAMSMQEIKVTFKILNPESDPKQWSDIKVRYYFTPTMQAPPMVTFDYVQKWASTMLTATATASYVEIGFAASTGTVNGFDNITGSDQIQLRLFNFSTTSWNGSQDDDHSYKSCAGVTNTTAYTDRLTMPGYYQGQIAWGTEPAL